jgi:hypothetical protein
MFQTTKQIMVQLPEKWIELRKNGWVDSHKRRDLSVKSLDKNQWERLRE